MGSVQSLLDTARAEIGVSEDPPGSNLVKYSYWYPMPGEPWCAMFVSWCAAYSDNAAVIPKHAYTPDGANWFRDHGAWYSSPRPGDVVYFQWATSDRICHVGIVETVYSNGDIDTVEGNTDSSGGGSGGRVMRQHRTAYIVGYGRPDFEDGGDSEVATYYCEAAQNTGQAVSAGGEDIRLQDDHDDDLGWHDEVNNYPSIAPDRPVKGNAAATCQLEDVDGSAYVALRTYSTENEYMRTIAAQTIHGNGWANVAGYVSLSKGHRLRLYVKPSSGEVTVRNAVLSYAARDR